MVALDKSAVATRSRQARCREAVLTMASTDAELVALRVMHDDMPEIVAVPLFTDHPRAGGNPLGRLAWVLRADGGYVAWLLWFATVNT